MRLTPPVPLLRLLLLSALMVTALDARQPSQPGPTFRAKVDLVRVDVSVTDRADRPVGDLTAADFEVREDGAPQTIEALQFVRLDGTRTSDLDESLAIRSRAHAALEAAREDVRLFVIFWDDYHVDKGPAVMLPLRKALKALVQQFGPNDLVAIMDPLTPVDALELTRSTRALLNRIEAFKGRRNQVMPVRSAAEEEQLRQRNPWELRAGVTLSALNSIVTHLGGLREGRKSVLFVSQGPPVGDPGSSNRDRLEEVVRSANRGNVTIHVFDPRPLGTAPFGGAEGLARLAAETGGRRILDSNSARALPEIISDASAYYLLGYMPPRDLADGRFHRIEVTVKRKGTRVLARRGYWAPTAAEAKAVEAPPPLAPALARAFSSLVGPTTGRAAEVWVGTSAGPEGTTRLTIAWEPTGGATAERAVRLAIAPLARDRRTPLAAPQTLGDGDGAAAGVATFDLADRAEAVLRFSAEAADGTVVDRWDEIVEVPRFDGRTLTLSTPRFVRARSPREARAMERGTDPAPAASHRFGRTDRVTVVLECYGSDGTTPVGSAELLNAQGRKLVDLAAPAILGGTLRLPLPVSSLAPGTYAVRVDVRAGEDRAAQHVAFEVVP